MPISACVSLFCFLLLLFGLEGMCPVLFSWRFTTPTHATSACVRAPVSRPGGGSVYYNWLRDELALLLAQPGRGNFAVMAEKSQPAFADDERQPFFLVRERGERIGVEAHDPSKRQMRRHGHE